MKPERQPLATIYDVHESDDGVCDRCGRKSKVGVEIALTGSQYEYACESCVTRQLLATKAWQAKNQQPSTSVVKAS